MRNFRELQIWQKGFQIATNCYKITIAFPKEERFGLCAQINRSSVSIASNIAEGSSRSSNKDFKRFIEISLGSTFELETQLLLAKEFNFGDQKLIGITLELITEEEKMLSAFSKAIKVQIG